MIPIKRRMLLFAVLPCLLFVFLAVPAFASAGGSGIFSGLESIANFIKRLFVPADDYFFNKLSTLNDLMNDRFGGIAYLYQMLHYFFSSLGSSSTSGLTFTLPNNYFWPGFRGLSVDFFQMARPYVNVLRSVLTASYCLFIGVCCYHKLRTLFRE